jgi:hypothetical protein
VWVDLRVPPYGASGDTQTRGAVKKTETGDGSGAAAFFFIKAEMACP